MDQPQSAEAPVASPQATPAERQALGYNALARLAGHISAADMRALNAAIDVGHQDVKAVAAAFLERMRAARNLVWAQRCKSGQTIDIACLKIGPAYVLHMPGELFVEYQLAAQKMRPDSPVLMAAYGDYGPGYIGTAIAYTQGGYETGPVSRVAPEVEEALMQGMRELLK